MNSRNLLARGMLDPTHPFIIRYARASLVVQWVRIHLPMQATLAQSLVWEMPPAVEQPSHAPRWLRPHSRARGHGFWAGVPQPLKPVLPETALCNRGNHRSEKPRAPQPEKAQEKQGAAINSFIHYFLKDMQNFLKKSHILASPLISEQFSELSERLSPG